MTASTPLPPPPSPARSVSAAEGALAGLGLVGLVQWLQHLDSSTPGAYSLGSLLNIGAGALNATVILALGGFLLIRRG